MIKRNHQQTVKGVLLSATTIILAALGLIIGLFLFIHHPAQAAKGPVSFPTSGFGIVVIPKPGPGQPPIYIPPPTPEELYRSCLAQGGGTCLFSHCGGMSISSGGVATTGRACLVEIPPVSGRGPSGVVVIPPSLLPSPTPTSSPTPTPTPTPCPDCPPPPVCPDEE